MSAEYSYLFVKAVLTLGFVLCLLLVAVYAIRFYMNRTGGRTNGTNPKGTALVRVLHTSGLGSKKNLAIVDVAGEVLVLGLTQSSINMLTKVEDPAAIEEIKRRHSAKRPLFSLLQGGL